MTKESLSIGWVSQWVADGWVGGREEEKLLIFHLQFRLLIKWQRCHHAPYLCQPPSKMKESGPMISSVVRAILCILKTPGDNQTFYKLPKETPVIFPNFPKTCPQHLVVSIVWQENVPETYFLIQEFFKGARLIQLYRDLVSLGPPFLCLGHRYPQ